MHVRGRSILTRLVALVFVAVFIPGALLVSGSWYVSGQARQQMERQVDEALNLAINLEQTLIDARLTRVQDRAIFLSNRPEVIAALTSGLPVASVLDAHQRAVPGADLVVVVDRMGVVRGRAGSPDTGDIVQYSGLVAHVVDGRTPVAGVTVIPQVDLVHEPAAVVSQVRMPIIATEAAQDPRVGSLLEDALALVGAAPVLDKDNRVIGAVLVSDILNNDHGIVDEVTSRSPPGLPLHATIALDGVRVTTTVPAVGGGRRAVGTLYSDRVMNNLRQGLEYRGRALVGGWSWERTIYLPLTDHNGRVVAGSFVGVPEAAFADLVKFTSTSTGVATALSLVALTGAVLLAFRMALTTIVRPLRRFTAAVTAGDLHSRFDPVGNSEIDGMAVALTGLTERVRMVVAEMARVSRGVRAASDDLALEAQATAENADAALQVAAATVTVAEQVADSVQRATGRMRDLELTLARIDAGTDEQARTLRHASQIVALLAGAVQESRNELAGVLEATRVAVAAAQQGRHSALRTVSALDLVRLEAQSLADGPPSEAPGRMERLLSDIEAGQSAAGECDQSLGAISRAADGAKNRLWEMAAVLTESGARAGAVSQQMSDLAGVAGETASQLRTMSDASRQVIGEAEAMAEALEATVSQVRRAEGHVTSIAGANRRLRDLSERIRSLAHELDRATARFPQH